MKTYAGLWLRTRAFLWDYLVIACYLVAITILSLLTNVNESLFTNRIQSQLSAFLFLTLPVVLYFSFLESSVQQGTWGKQKRRLKVIDQNGGRIIFARALARTLLKFVPWEISHTLIWEIYFSPQINSVIINYGFILVYFLIGLNIASVLLTKSRQTIYDILTKSYVEKVIG